MNRSMRRVALGAGFLTLALTTGAASPPATEAAAMGPTITVYKDPGCECCDRWIEHLIKHGYRVNAKDTPDMTKIEKSLGVPEGLTACHTAVVNGYLIEGHVPAADIDRLLKQKSHVAGLAVPGMPGGSPGMESASSEHYQVLSFDKTGKTKVFASH